MGDNGVVIVGAGAGGDAAAFGLRQKGYPGKVTLIGRDPYPPYERPYLSKQFLRDNLQPKELLLRPEGEYEHQGIDLITGRRGYRGRSGLPLGLFDDGRRLSFDTLVLATGATPRWLPEIPRAENIFALRSMQDAMAIRDALTRAHRVLVLGAGFIGAEIAASVRHLDKDVLMVELASTPLQRVLGSEAGDAYADLHRRHGVDLRLGTAVSAWEISEGRLKAVELNDGSREAVDAAVVGLGVTPNLELPVALGLPIGDGGILVGEELQAAPHVYAVGDIAAHMHPVYGRRLRVEHWQVAQRQGSAVAASIAEEPAPYREIPWFWSDQYDVNLQVVGNAVGFDTMVWRGLPQDNKYAVFYLKDGLLESCLAANDGRSIRFARDLISRRARLIESALADPSLDLRSLTTE